MAAGKARAAHGVIRCPFCEALTPNGGDEPSENARRRRRVDDGAATSSSTPLVMWGISACGFQGPGAGAGGCQVDTR
ncbi:MAG: hypothetical protein ACR2MO_14380, partial [Acidimicrobiales bacterium]